MKQRIRGIVLESTYESLVLLTKEGEYVKLPSPGQLYHPGEEVELKQPKERKTFLPYIAAAAVIVLLIGALNFVSPFLKTPQPYGYIAVDINPGVFLVLDEETRIESYEAFNSDGEKIIQELSLEEKNAAQAVNKILDKAHGLGYLPPEKENTVLISLSASEKAAELEEELNITLAEQILKLDTNAYLVISQAQKNIMEENHRKGISPNAQALAEEMASKGFPEDELKEEPGGQPLPVRELLQKEPPGEIFQEENQVKSKAHDEKRIEGPPEEIKEKLEGKEHPVYGPDNDKGPPETPPGLEKKQNKQTGPEGAPGQQKERTEESSRTEESQNEMKGQGRDEENEPQGRPESPGESNPPGQVPGQDVNPQSQDAKPQGQENTGTSQRGNAPGSKPPARVENPPAPPFTDLPETN